MTFARNDVVLVRAIIHDVGERTASVWIGHPVPVVVDLDRVSPATLPGGGERLGMVEEDPFPADGNARERIRALETALADLHAELAHARERIRTLETALAIQAAKYEP